jgi:hypothetical protein
MKNACSIHTYSIHTYWRYCAAVLLLIIAIGCRPKNEEMLVANVQGDVFLPRLSASPWNFGGVMECQIASRTSISPDGRGDLLLCGEKTQLAWSQTWLRPDIKTQIYAATERHAVEFRSVGHPLLGNRYKPRSWQCRKTPDRVVCD